MTTHHLNEADYLADRISILNQGKIYISDYVSRIKENFGKGYKISISNNDFTNFD